MDSPRTHKTVVYKLMFDVDALLDADALCDTDEYAVYCILLLHRLRDDAFS